MVDWCDEWVDEVFDALVDADDSLDQVIRDLAAAGVEVAPDQRHVVVRWLDSFETNTSVPLTIRLVVLRDWLAAAVSG